MVEIVNLALILILGILGGLSDRRKGASFGGSIVLDSNQIEQRTKYDGGRVC